MDSQLKERIVGAAVLVALGVWLIPWVIDGRHGPDETAAPADELSLPADAARAPVRTETVELAPPPADTPAANVTAANAASAGTRSANASSADAGREPLPAAAAPSPDSGSAASAAGEPPGQSPSEASPARAGGARAKVPPPAAASAAAEPPETGWSVQIGSFSEPANARQQASRVAEFGYQAQVFEYTSAGKPMHRVRVMGFASREQAEAAASALSVHGFQPRVFPPE